jgi:hypothetical protein
MMGVIDVFLDFIRAVMVLPTLRFLKCVLFNGTHTRFCPSAYDMQLKDTGRPREWPQTYDVVQCSKVVSGYHTTLFLPLSGSGTTFSTLNWPTKNLYMFV